MKRGCGFILALALLFGLAACGVDTPPPATETTSSGEPASEAPSKAAFERALQLYKYFFINSMQVDREDTLERDGITYYRVTDPAYPTMGALALALSELFLFEITQEYLHRTLDGTHFLYIGVDAHDETLYTCMGDRGADVVSYSVGAVSESESKIVSKLTTVNFSGETTEILLTQELIDGQWLFTDFPLDW